MLVLKPIGGQNVSAAHQCLHINSKVLLCEWSKSGEYSLITLYNIVRVELKPFRYVFLLCRLSEDSLQ